MNFILQWILQPKNALISILIFTLIGFFTYNKYLNHIIENKDKEIISLNKNISDLKSSIDLQNTSIKNMNTDYEKQISDYKLQVEKTKKENQKNLDYIKKANNYVRPEGMNACQATKKVISDYIDMRDAK